MVIVVAQGNAEHLLGFVLPDDKSVEVVFNLAWLKLEFKLVRFPRRVRECPMRHPLPTAQQVAHPQVAGGAA